MLEKDSQRGGYTSDSETSSTGGERNTAVGDQQLESSSKGGYRSTVYIETNGNGIEDPKKVFGGKNGGYNSDSEVSNTATETNMIEGPRKVCPFGYTSDSEASTTATETNMIEGPRKPVTILDLRDDSGLSDNLHLGSDKSSTGCNRGRCLGSKMNTDPHNKPLSTDAAINQAKDFLQQYYSDTINHEKPSQSRVVREKEVVQELRLTGTYNLTHDELVWGARMAWRNAPRCPARVIWKRLTVFDRRHIDTADEMFQALCEHIEYSNNGGNIRPAITVFRQRQAGKTDPRVWNNLMVQYAGYEQEDGSVIGDPAAVGITKFCEMLGWRGKGTQFDFLPMLLSGSDGQPRYYELPEKLCLEVKIKHPSIEAITNLGLKWFGLPGVSSMMFECGGIQFPGAPFAGWYQVTEVANRDFLDPQRYNLLTTIGEAMGLDTSSNSSFWKDEVALELNKAVLSSYQEAGVSMVDHFTQADQFVSHMQEETKVRGGCPADWVWIVPPQSGSLVSTFHQEMLNYHLSPSYEYQDKPYETWFRSEKRKTFRSVALSVLLWTSVYVKMVSKRKVFKIFYSSETGTAKKFAKEALDLLNMSFKTEMFPLNEKEGTFESLSDSDVAIIIVSTFGNGEAPGMSRDYMKMMNTDLELLQSGDPAVRKKYEELGLKNKRYAVFGLGSSAYPKFAAFSKTMDELYETFGASRLFPRGTGDELKDQKGSFTKWLKKVFLASLKEMGVEAPKSYLEKMSATKQHKWRISGKERNKDVNFALAEYKATTVRDFRIIKRSQLHQEKDEPATIQVDFDYQSPDVSYEAGEHLTIFPRNEKRKVELLKSRLNNNPPDRRLVTLVVYNDGLWRKVEDLPTEICFDDFLTYFVDINTVPSQPLLGLLAKYAEDDKEKEALTLLANDDDIYSEWRDDNKDICDVMLEFISINITSSLLVSQLPLIKPRRYSIASSPRDNTLSLIVGVVGYTTKDGRQKRGLASGMLATAEVGTQVAGCIKLAQGSRLILPQDPVWPVIMIGAGSGIAPFRGFWMKRWQQQQAGHTVGKTLLYFGCRKKTMNLLKNETEGLTYHQSFFTKIKKSGGLDFEREVAYSREVNHPRQYVQNLISRDAVKIYDYWINKGCYIYVCGKIQMAEAVEKTLLEILKHIGNMDTEAAQEKFDSMRRNLRYQEDIFG